MSNKEIRCALINCGVKQYKLAERLGITESTLSKKLRKELGCDERLRMLEAISELAKEGC